MKAIHEMEMPFECKDCRFCRKYRFAGYRCTVTGVSIPKWQEGRHRHCPLIPIEYGKNYVWLDDGGGE